MSISVLIADDHTVVRDGLQYMLDAQHDIHVIGDAANGREAVEKVLQLQPEIILIDINMAELNGIEASLQIREKLPSAKVIILSMYASSEHIFRALKAGVRGYLLKESAGVEVIEAVRAVAAGHRYLSEKISEKVIDDYVRQREHTVLTSPLEFLSPREREVLQLVVEGKSSVDIADILYLSPKTVETYRSRIMRKLELKDLSALVKFAIQHGLTELE
jgi:DNA-binding NarL/FixJ family response regulator